MLQILVKSMTICVALIGPTTGTVSRTPIGCYVTAPQRVTQAATRWEQVAVVTAITAVTRGRTPESVMPTAIGCSPTARGHVMRAVKVTTLRSRQ